MSIKCLMNGLEVDYPCSPVCALFGDCVSAFSDYQRTKVRTNADRIRAMTDEELAKWLADMWDCNYCSENERLEDNPLLIAEQCDGKCDQHCLEWLKQSAREDA